MSSELDAQSKKIATRKNRHEKKSWRFFLNSELRTQNSELRTQNTELRTQNSEHRTQNTEHRTQNNDTDLELNCGQCLLSVVRCL